MFPCSTCFCITLCIIFHPVCLANLMELSGTQFISYPTISDSNLHLDVHTTGEQRYVGPLNLFMQDSGHYTLSCLFCWHLNTFGCAISSFILTLSLTDKGGYNSSSSLTIDIYPQIVPRKNLHGPNRSRIWYPSGSFPHSQKISFCTVWDGESYP